LIPQVSGMMYAHQENTIYTTFYASSITKVPLAAGSVSLKQEADYPFKGAVRIAVEAATPKMFELRLRIPTWCRGNQFVPGELYHYQNKTEKSWSVSINGEPYDAPLEGGFAVINRTWKAGDQILLDLPMPVRFNTAVAEVEANRDRMALTRGPLVFAAEEADNAGKVQEYFMENVPKAAQIAEQRIDRGLLKDVVQISVPAKRKVDDRLLVEELTMIPYYAWNNRGVGSMMVWLPNSTIKTQ